MATAKRTVVESGFKVTVDEATSFRLADLEPYRKLSGLSLKEMDTAGRSRLFGIQRLTVVDLDVAAKMGLPVERNP